MKWQQTWKTLPGKTMASFFSEQNMNNYSYKIQTQNVPIRPTNLSMEKEIDLYLKGNMHMISPDRTRFYCQILAYLNTIHLLYGTRCLSYWFC